MGADCVVSIIMPVYKSEEYIRRAILSVVNQTYPHIELLCINDATPDSSFEICKEMQKAYSNIVLLENDVNRGLEFTRNRGLDNATGDYILFLDSDDELAPTAVEELMAIAEVHHPNVVFFGFSRVIQGKEYPVIASDLEERVYSIAEFSEHILSDISIGLLTCVGSKLYRAKDIKRAKLYFDKKYKYNEDGGFVFNFLLSAETVYYYNKPFYKYLIRNSNSIMSSYRPQMFSTIVKARELIKEIYIKNNVWGTKQQIAYYKEMLGLMLNSLINEVKFGDSKSFKAAMQTVRQYEDFHEMIDCLKRNGALPLARKTAVFFWEHNQAFLLRLLVKLQMKKQG